MEIIYYNSQTEFLKNHLKDFINLNEEKIKITIIENTEAFYGCDTSIDKEWCDKNGILYAQNKLVDDVGCIVSIKGNIVLDIIKKGYGDIRFSDNFSKALCEYFKSKGMNSVRQDNNDVLVDGFKVASGAEAILSNNFHFVGYQISINQDLNAIKHICKKPMEKVPKALSEYGITTEEMLEFCEKYWE